MRRSVAKELYGQDPGVMANLDAAKWAVCSTDAVNDPMGDAIMDDTARVFVREIARPGGFTSIVEIVGDDSGRKYVVPREDIKLVDRIGSPSLWVVRLSDIVAEVEEITEDTDDEPAEDSTADEEAGK